MKHRVYIGYDPREDIAYQVCKYSIETRNPGIEVIPLKQQELRNYKLYWREVDKLAATEFTFTRFLIPELNKFEGWALFCDCDILFLTDVQELFDQVDDQYAVMCAQHDYKPKDTIKMDGQVQSIYPRKNWSSVMLINCGHASNKKLTKELVNSPDATGAFLHRFSWLDDSEVGEFSHEWNWLVDWYEEPTDGIPKALHYTSGGPWFENYRFCDYHTEWKDELSAMMNDSPEENND
jgi:lipopolysaccharide biosynthesis glycosyltransferase